MRCGTGWGEVPRDEGAPRRRGASPGGQTCGTLPSVTVTPHRTRSSAPAPPGQSVSEATPVTLATFPPDFPEPRTGRMPHRQPRNHHLQIHQRQLAGGPFTRAGDQRTYGGLGRAGVSPDGIPLLLRDSIDATAARAVPTAPFATTIVSGPPVRSLPRLPRASPDPLRAPCNSGSCPSRFSSSKSVPPAGSGVPSAPDAVPSALPGLQDGRTFAAIGPTPGRGVRGFPAQATPARSSVRRC